MCATKSETQHSTIPTRLPTPIFPIGLRFLSLYTLREMSASSLARSVTRANLSPTVSTLPTGVPKAAYINFVARAPHDAHGHGSHTVPAPRSDKAQTWAQSMSLKPVLGGAAFRTKVNGQ